MKGAAALGLWLAGSVGVARPSRPISAAACDLAVSNGVAAILLRQIAEAGAPGAAVERLKAARGREVALALRVDQVAANLFEAFGSAGIPLVALKGVALRRALYAPLGMVRAPGDLDVLVRTESLDAARAILDEHGFEPSRKHPRGFYRSHHHIRPRLLRGDAAIVVDLHHALLKPPHPFRLDLEQIWERSVALEDAPAGIRRLGDLDLALHSVLQIDHDDAYGGKGRALYDLLLWIHTRALDPVALQARAEELGAVDAWRRVQSAISQVFGLGDASGGLRNRWWGTTLRAAVWRTSARRAIPTWYVYWCAQVLRDERAWGPTLWQLLRPVLANPRMGGRGFRD